MTKNTWLPNGDDFTEYCDGDCKSCPVYGKCSNSYLFEEQEEEP